MENLIKQYVHRKKNGHHRRVGIMVAFREGNNIYVGWSLCHVKKDIYNQEEGQQIAIDRARARFGKVMKIPHSMRKAFPEFLARASKYFRTNMVSMVQYAIMPQENPRVKNMPLGKDIKFVEELVARLADEDKNFIPMK